MEDQLITVLCEVLVELREEINSAEQEYQRRAADNVYPAAWESMAKYEALRHIEKFAQDKVKEGFGWTHEDVVRRVVG